MSWRRRCQREAAGERWWAAFYDPPARIHTQSNLLTEAKAAGGTRNKRQRLYLDWLRNLHTAKEAELRGSAEWREGDWGSPYSTFWPAGANATPTSVNLEHIVCSEWLRNGELVRESGYARQDATIRLIGGAANKFPSIRPATETSLVLEVYDVPVLTLAAF